MKEEYLIKRIENFKEALREVEKSSLEETISDIKNERYPEMELDIWERIAETYKRFIYRHNVIDLAIKQELFETLLIISNGVEDFRNTKHLTEEEIKEIISIYEEEKIIFSVIFTKSEIEEWVESNYKKEISDVELNRISEGWFECEKVFGIRTEFLDTVIEDALNNESNRWEDTDKDFLARSNTTTK